MSLEYRADIDGLRAIAVSSVMAFHAFPDGIATKGGFTGVDIFFVISGYLITRIIASEMEEGTFSVAVFYARRIKRIIPALLLVLCFSLVAGWFVLMPGDYDAMAQSAIYAIFSVSNLFFLSHTGYFDAAAQTMPLLHTWSLGVEEQFYLVWPAVLLGLMGLKRKFGVPVLLVISMLAILSLLHSVLLVSSDAKAAFYLSTSRAYELLIGAALALIFPVNRHRIRQGSAHAASVAGIALIAYGLLALDADRPFPGWSGLIPTIGAAFVIVGGEGVQPGLFNSVLAWRPFVFVGKISYSLYLWHWPVFVLFAHYAGAHPSSYEAILLMIVSLALASLSYRLVEQPSRQSRLGPLGSFKRFAVGAGAVSVLATAVILTNGAQGRVPVEATSVASLDAMWEWSCPDKRGIEGLQPGAEFCTFGAPWDTASRRAFLWGDSHAEHYAPLLDIVGRDRDISFVLYRACSAIIDGEVVFRRNLRNANYSINCGKKRRAALEWLSSQSGIDVVLASSWQTVLIQLQNGNGEDVSPEEASALMRRGLELTLRGIDTKKNPIIILGQVPPLSRTDIQCAQRAFSNILTRTCGEANAVDARGPLERLSRSHEILAAMDNGDSVRFVPVASRLCGLNLCTTMINNDLIYRDDNHIRRNLSESTKRLLLDRMALGAAFSGRAPADT